MADAGGYRTATCQAFSQAAETRSRWPSAIISHARRNEEAVRLVVAALLAALCIVVAVVSANVAIKEWPLP